MSKGIGLLDFEDDTDTFELAEEDSIGQSPIPAAVRQAIVIEKANQTPTKLIALRYQTTPATVNRIWKEFCKSASQVRKVADETPAETKAWLRGKALAAIESGLECDRDPYRRAGVGIHVMRGIGEFKSDQPEGARVAVLIGQLPEDWKTRYIGGPGSTDK